MRFISHLDLLRLFARAARRAGLPVELTRGFNPHPKISITKALKLGIESSHEEAVFYMEDAVTPQAFMKAMNENLPEGIRLSAAEETA
jgi:radical SAM-linked protein